MAIKTIFPRLHGTRKNTRKWCKGVVGRAHAPEWTLPLEMIMPTGRRIIWERKRLVCTVCGKVLKYDWSKK